MQPPLTAALDRRPGEAGLAARAEHRAARLQMETRVAQRRAGELGAPTDDVGVQLSKPERPQTARWRRHEIEIAVSGSFQASLQARVLFAERLNPLEAYGVGRE